MQEIKLSDQLGAMAIIDELYQQRQLLLEHLDRDTLHSNLKENIKNYYQDKNLTIDDATIEEGINLWFDQRLRFNAPKRSWFQHLLVFCYIKRNILFSIVGIILLACTLLIYSALDRAKKLKNDIDSTYKHILASKKSLIDLNNKFIEINTYPVNLAQVPTKELKASISNLLNQEIIPSLAKPVIETSFVTQKEKDTLAKLQKIDLSMSHKLSEITSQVMQLSRLLEEDQQLTNLIRNEAFINASKQYPILQVTIDSVLDRLNSGEKTIDLNQINKLYSSIGRAEAAENKIQADTKQLQALKVPKSDMGDVIALQTSLRADLKNLKFDNMDHYHEMMAYYIKLAQTPLIMTIVDNPRYKSGVERTHDNTNGKSWYLIVTPISPSGVQSALWIKSIETGETKQVKMFGQQVTQQAFNNVKADKAQDGHIDNNKLCNKPLGRLTFDCPSSVKPGRILEW